MSSDIQVTARPTQPKPPRSGVRDWLATGIALVALAISTSGYIESHTARNLSRRLDFEKRRQDLLSDVRVVEALEDQLQDLLAVLIAESSSDDERAAYRRRAAASFQSSEKAESIHERIMRLPTGTTDDERVALEKLAVEIAATRDETKRSVDGFNRLFAERARLARQ